MRKIIYKTICEKLIAANIGVQFVSLWNQNTEQLTTQQAFLMPAVFIEFEPIEWTQLSGGARSADVRVRLHLVTETLATAEDGGKYQDWALEHFDLIDRIGLTVQGLAGKGFNRLMPVESVTDHDHERIRHDEECYVTRITDTSAIKPQKTISGVKLVRG